MHYNTEILNTTNMPEFKDLEIGTYFSWGTVTSWYLKIGPTSAVDLTDGRPSTNNAFLGGTKLTILGKGATLTITRE